MTEFGRAPFGRTTSTFAVLLIKGTCCGAEGDSTDASTRERVPVRECPSERRRSLYLQTVEFLEMCQKGHKR